VLKPRFPGDYRFEILPCIFAVSSYIAIKVRQKKKFENKIKKRIMRLVLSMFGSGFKWACDAQGTAVSITRQTIERSGLFTFNSMYYDDCFSGEYSDVNVELSEVSLYNQFQPKGGGRIELRGAIPPPLIWLLLIEWLFRCFFRRSVISKSCFRGILVSFDMNKKFEKHTLIVRNSLIKSLVKKHRNLERVTLEDVEFEKLYAAFSEEQVEARYLITTAFIERFKNIRRVFKTNDVRCSFRGDEILLAIGAKGDMFSLGKLSKSVSDPGQYYKLFEEFAAVLSLIDVLKLNQKLGL
jgi:hypothetical protein